MFCDESGAASCSGRGDKGPMAFFSWMELTTFSRSIGVVCLPRAWLLVESWRWQRGREMDELDCVVAVTALSETESSEPTLEESSGSSVSWCARRASNDQRGGNVESFSQQKVSRDHSLQARFS
jgi:hypothetical protein